MAATCPCALHTCKCKCLHACVCRCVCVCEVYVGLLISFLLGYVLCEITQVQPTVIFVEVCFVCPKGSFLLPSLPLSLSRFYIICTVTVPFFNNCIYCVYIIICKLFFCCTFFLIIYHDILSNFQHK